MNRDGGFADFAGFSILLIRLVLWSLVLPGFRCYLGVNGPKFSGVSQSLKQLLSRVFETSCGPGDQMGSHELHMVERGAVAGISS